MAEEESELQDVSPSITESSDILQLLADEFIDTSDIANDVGLHLECSDDGIQPNINWSGSSQGNSDITCKTPVNAINRPLTVDIPVDANTSYRLTFPPAEESKRILCNMCNKTFTRKSILLNHKAISHGVKDLFPCLECNKYVGQRYHHLMKHIKRNHKQRVETTSLIGKETIPKTTLPSPSAAEQTNQMPDTDVSATVADIITDTPATRKNRNRQKNKIHLKSKTETNFRCAVCNKSFERNRQLTFHRRVHLEKTFKCDIDNCPKVFKTRSAVNEHKQTVHCPKVFICHHDGCDKSYALKRDLDYHRRQHDNGLLCPVCGRSFRDKYNLDKHTQTHTGEKDLQCQRCDYKCIQRSSMTWHMKHHHHKLNKDVHYSN